MKQSREDKQQPPAITPYDHEIDPFGTDLQLPGHRKIETAANGAAVTYSITPSHIDPLDQLTSSRHVVRNILVNEFKKNGWVEVHGDIEGEDVEGSWRRKKQRKTQCTSSRKPEQ